MKVTHKKPSIMGREKPHMGAFPTMAGHPLALYIGGPTSHQTRLHQTRVLPPQKATKHGLPPKGGAPTKQPTNHGILSPHAGTRCFPRPFLPKKIRKVPEHFWYPLKLFWACFETFPVWWFNSETFSFTPKQFRFSLRNFSVVSETFPATFSQTPCLVFSR
jgi:hypothetical protein